MPGSPGVRDPTLKPRIPKSTAPHKLDRNNGGRSDLGAQILKDLGVSSIRLLASRERHYVGLEGFDIKIDETEILDT